MSSLTDRFKKPKILIVDVASDAPSDATVAAVVATVVPTATKEQIAVAIEKDKAAEIADLRAKLAAAEAKASPVLEKTHAARVEQASQMLAEGKINAVQAGNIITPPDQPKSDPKLAADPVPGFSPIPEPLKNTPPAPAEQHNTAAVPPAPAEPPKRGRPAGAKNKPKEDVKIDPFDTPVTRVKVSLGATVKFNPEDPKCFEFIRADVGMERDVVGGDEEVKLARKKLSDDCAQALVEELEKMKASVT